MYEKNILWIFKSLFSDCIDTIDGFGFDIVGFSCGRFYRRFGIVLFSFLINKS